MQPRKITISRQQHYGCMMCGRCCRRFYVLLSRAEKERIQTLDWKDEPDVPTDFCQEINGFLYYRRRPDGGCLFLDDKGVCRMHRRFGFEKKALTCRGYPFNIVSTFPGEVSVLVRMDCPAVLEDHGPAITEQRQDIEKLVAELHFGSGFTPTQLKGMERHAVEALCAKFQELLKDEAVGMADCMRAMMHLARRAEALGGTFLSDRETMLEVYPSLLSTIKADVPEMTRYGLNTLSKSLFRQFLSYYCRRDEELLKTGLGSRLRQTWNIGKLCLGYGNLARFGYEFPDFPIRRARLFDRVVNEARTQTSIAEQREVWATYRRFLSVRLECFQFFGVAYYGTDIFSGLIALFLTYPIVLAFARIWAASRGVECIAAEDVKHAIGAMDHCHGRSPALKFKSIRSRERMLANSYSQLVFALGDN